MTRKTAKDFDPQVLRLFDRYVHGDLSRPGFLQSAGIRHEGYVYPGVEHGLQQRYDAAP